ncbi:MAG: colanic acid biosynthesis acetyltransferase WcaF [Mucilaginibacter polytrichastri]|nr:colanic acid biosynthesis acetyltransferase WcaF [Mucilaginibacter polytrichastri]
MKSTDLSVYNRNNYHPGASRVVRAAWYLINLLVFKTGWLPFSPPKILLLRLFGAKAGKNCVIKPHVSIKYPWHVTLGDFVWIGEKAWIDNHVTVQIGSHVCLSQGAMIMTGNHNYSSTHFDLITKPVVIENGVWIGAGATICPGITAGSHSVLTAGSVATRNLEAYSIYQGNPAVRIRTREIS